MAMTATQLRARLKANIHNLAGLTDPDDYDLFLTLGQQRMVRDSPATLGIKSGSLSLVDNTREYSLAADVYQVKGVFYPTGNKWLTAIPVGEFIRTVEWLATIPEGQPEGYCVTRWDATSGFWKIAFDHDPGASLTYTYWYYWMPADISGTAVPAVSAIGFGTALLWAATMEARQGYDMKGLEQAQIIYEREMIKYRAFDAQGPDYHMALNPDSYGGGGSTLRLPPEYPAD